MCPLDKVTFLVDRIFYNYRPTKNLTDIFLMIGEIDSFSRYP